MSWDMAQSHSVELALLTAHDKEKCGGKVSFDAMCIPSAIDGGGVRASLLLCARCSECGPVDVANPEIA